MQFRKNDVTVIVDVTEKGPMVEGQFGGSLHALFDEASQAGIQLPHGLWYVGPLGKGLSHPVDETKLEIVFDPSLITETQIRSFLESLGLRLGSSRSDNPNVYLPR